MLLAGRISIRALCRFALWESAIPYNLGLNKLLIRFIILAGIIMSEEPTNILPNNDLKRILVRLDSIDAPLEKLEARAYDTKPIWENALKEITDTCIEIRQGFEKSRAEMESGLRRVERKIDVLNQNILDARADQRELEERVSKLDSQPAQ